MIRKTSLLKVFTLLVTVLYTTPFPQTKRLEGNLSQTSGHTKRLESRVVQTRNKIIQGRQLIEKGINLINQLQDLDNKMHSIIRVLKVLGRVPKVNRFTNTILHSLQGTHRGVHKTTRKMVRVRDRQLQPAVNKLKAQENRLNRVHSYFMRVQSKVNFARNLLGKGRRLVERKKLLKRPFREVEKGSKIANTIIVPLNQALSKIESSINRVVNGISAIQRESRSIARAMSEIRRFKRVFGKISRVTGKVNRVLDKRRIVFRKRFTLRKLLTLKPRWLKRFRRIRRKVNKIISKILRKVLNKLRIRVPRMRSLGNLNP